MKKINAKSLRAGQTIYYVTRNWLRGDGGYSMRSLVVMTDRAEIEPDYVIASGRPRRYLREAIADGYTPEFQSYSRRRVLSWIAARSRVKA